MKVLITGSREASSTMLAKAREVIAWCTAANHTILVGDASGVDALVRRTAARFHCQVYGAYGRFREPAIGGQLVRSDFPDYPDRDRFLARECDLCVAIWNGRSSGTRYTGQYVETLGKRTIWRVFGQA